MAKIVPKANVRGEVFEAAGTLTAGTFVIKGTGGVASRPRPRRRPTESSPRTP